jgi:hypothetical protein
MEKLSCREVIAYFLDRRCKTCGVGSMQNRSLCLECINEYFVHFDENIVVPDLARQIKEKK